jgi:hypothetical protein
MQPSDSCVSMGCEQLWGVQVRRLGKGQGGLEVLEGGKVMWRETDEKREREEGVGSGDEEMIDCINRDVAIMPTLASCRAIDNVPRR